MQRNGIAAVDHCEQERLAVAGVRASGRRTGSTSTDEPGELVPYPCALLQFFPRQFSRTRPTFAHLLLRFRIRAHSRGGGHVRGEEGGHGRDGGGRAGCAGRLGGAPRGPWRWTRRRSAVAAVAEPVAVAGHTQIGRASCRGCFRYRVSRYGVHGYGSEMTSSPQIRMRPSFAETSHC